MHLSQHLQYNSSQDKDYILNNYSILLQLLSHINIAHK